jgi:hypothetical protein
MIFLEHLGTAWIVGSRLREEAAMSQASSDKVYDRATYNTVF